MKKIILTASVVASMALSTAPAFAEEKDSLNGRSKSIFGIVESVDMKLILKKWDRVIFCGWSSFYCIDEMKQYV